MKLVNEARKILELPDLLVAPTTVRVPVFTATRSRSTPRPRTRSRPRAGARGSSPRFPGLKLWDEPAENRYPMPVVVEGQDDCYVGRVREDLSHPERR